MSESDVLKQIDSAFAKAKLPEPVVVWCAAETLDLKPGSVVTKPDFTSTTLSRDVAEAAAAGEGDIWQFKLPAGAKAIYMGKFDNEAEVLVNRGLTLKVKSIKEWSPTQRLIVMEVANG